MLTSSCQIRASWSLLMEKVRSDPSFKARAAPPSWHQQAFVPDEEAARLRRVAWSCLGLTRGRHVGVAAAVAAAARWRRGRRRVRQVYTHKRTSPPRRKSAVLVCVLSEDLVDRPRRRRQDVVQGEPRVRRGLLRTAAAPGCLAVQDKDGEVVVNAIEWGGDWGCQLQRGRSWPV